MTRVPRPHDLIRVAPPTQVDGPAWVRPALAAAPWVVVRRASTPAGVVPVGIRGDARSQRHATVIDTSDILETLSPPELLPRMDQLPDLPAASALRAATAILDPTGLRWGPGGSVGFTLASGVVVMTADSDLDIVITAARLPSRDVLGALAAALHELPARVDCQIDLPGGGVALDEIVRAERVLVRTNDGPVLTPVAELAG
jgi:phosphoribosyl-dephospho-CoA transferase